MTRLFCDSSFDPRRRHGWAACLRVVAADPVEPNLDHVQFTFFANTTNTRLELQGVLSALEDVEDGAGIELFTDCATLANLVARRTRLESSKFESRNGRCLTNADLYRRLFGECDRLALQFRWLQGHKPSRERNATERLFAFVDRAARQKLRAHSKEERG